MKYDPQKHHRRSVRLPEYDYSQPGAYFITLVAHQREPLFGMIDGGEMRLSAIGQITDEHWRAIPAHFPSVALDAFVIMPNHIHGILVIQTVGATQWVAPTTASTDAQIASGPRPGSIGAIIGAFKMSVTRRVQRELNQSAVWQRNYYEHIIRDEYAHQNIHAYIEDNISNWANDEENPVNY
jgi:REP element-mobilizing transposase RayT